jgi:MFS family permease
VAIVLGLTCLKRLPRRERPHRLDILGAVLIIATTVRILIALDDSGLRTSWPALLLIVIIDCGLATLLVWRLLTAPEPLIPLAILYNRTARQAIVMHAFGWGGILGLNIYLPMYLQGVMRLSPSHGLSLIVLMTTLNISSALGATAVGRMTNYKTVPIAGLVLTVLSVLAHSAFADTITPLWFEALLVAIGLGFGPVGALSNAALQNTVASHQFGTALGVMNFMRVIMSAVTVAIFGALVVTGAARTAGPRPMPQGVVDVTGFRWIFVVGAASFAVALLMMTLLEHKPLRSDYD